MGDTWPQEVVSFKTSDDKLHLTRSTAEWWQGRLDGSRRATAMLESGSSLYSALVEGGFMPAGCYPELDEVFASTKLIISHWQCQETPGYQPVSIDSNGAIYVHGHAGSWSGPYGAKCSAMDVARYWATTKERTR